jgi:hypothetical protein
MRLSQRSHLDILHKDHLGNLRGIHAAPAFNPLLTRLESLCHQPEMNFEDASKGQSNIILSAAKNLSL